MTENGNENEGPLALTIIGAVFIVLGLLSLIAQTTPWVGLGFISLGVIQSIHYGRRYIRSKSVRPRR